MSCIFDTAVHSIVMSKPFSINKRLFDCSDIFGGTHPDNLGLLMVIFILYIFLAGPFSSSTVGLFLIYGFLRSTATTGPGLSGTVLFVVFTAQVIGIPTV